jgi:hypothetical protein
MIGTAEPASEANTRQEPRPMDPVTTLILAIAILATADVAAIQLGRPTRREAPRRRTAGR